jgi:MFS transporter, putative metabolite:H+ symporter
MYTHDFVPERLGHGPFQHRILLAAGLCFAADAMEVLLLSFLTVILQAEAWGRNDAPLTETELNTIISSVFIGAMLGTLTLGSLGDRIGRKPVFAMTAAIICCFGFLTAACTTYWQFLLCRFAVGFGVGGLIVPFDTLAELVPLSHRGVHLLTIEYFWTAGTLLVPVAAWMTLRDHQHDGGGGGGGNWRLFVALCAIPCLLSTVLGVLLVPESPRWLLAAQQRNRHDEAVQILRRAAICNGKDPDTIFPNGITIVDNVEDGDITICDLLQPNWIKTTLLLWMTWAGQAFLYYGTIIAVTLVFATESGGDANDDGNNNRGYEFDYPAIFAAASSELAGTTLVIFAVDRIGRVPSQALSYFFGGISAFVLCRLAASTDPQRSHLITAAFFARMFMMSGSCTTWVSTAEILTTEIRATGHSVANAVARIAGAISPYVVSSQNTFRTIGFVTLSLSMITCLSSSLLPETMGKSMGSTTELHRRQT